MTAQETALTGALRSAHQVRVRYGTPQGFGVSRGIFIASLWHACPLHSRAVPKGASSFSSSCFRKQTQRLAVSVLKAVFLLSCAPRSAW
jgi:hypothetical protein